MAEGIEIWPGIVGDCDEGRGMGETRSHIRVVLAAQKRKALDDLKKEADGEVCQFMANDEGGL